MTGKENLKNNKNDFLAVAAKSTLGAIPYAGPFLSELVSNLIPNQRIDRLTKFVIELDQKLSNISTEKLSNLITNEEFIDFLEEGFVQATRAFTEERRKYIISIIETGIKDDSIEFQDSKYLLKLLAELNDPEIIWLRFYLDPTNNGDNEFRTKHSNVLTPVSSVKGADKEIFNKASIQSSYKEHLERLNLIDNRVKFDRKTGFPEFEKTSGKPKSSGHSLTYLGKMLLEQIGLTT